jgi:hypothetical protein
VIENEIDYNKGNKPSQIEFLGIGFTSWVFGLALNGFIGKSSEFSKTQDQGSKFSFSTFDELCGDALASHPLLHRCS